MQMFVRRHENTVVVSHRHFSASVKQEKQTPVSMTLILMVEQFIQRVTARSVLLFSC